MKNYYLFIFYTFMSFSINAQFNFQTHTVIDFNNETNGSNSVYSADIDGDGDLDILSASNQDDKIAWFENLDGFGSFSKIKLISLNADYASSIFAIDIDNDGDMDVISASAIDNKIAWYENIDGQGNFGPQLIISTDVNVPASIFAIDIDNDGDNDIISASSLDNKIAWYQNDGQGNFSSQQVITNLTIGVNSVFAIDIDGDNDVDIISASSLDNTISWFENTNGLGDFGSMQIINSNANLANSVFASDIDNDGDIDVISGSSNSGISWYENIDGNGNFSLPQIISSDIFSISIYAIDFDNDGDNDILSTSFNDDKLVWFENTDGLGGFGTQNTITTNVISATSTLAFDIDGDGDNDVISASESDNKIAWYENLDAIGNFGEQQVLSNIADGLNSVFTSDLDGDGDLDILSASQNDNKISWYENINGEGDFSTQHIISINTENATSVYAIDLDGDGDLDVLSSSKNDNKIAWYENIDGLGNFSSQHIISTQANGANYVYADDIDGDGDNDVLSASSLDNKIAWYRNNGFGVFSSQIIITTNALNAKTVITDDIDNDGDIDIISASSDDDKIAWYENLDGIGNFSSQKIITTNAIDTKSISSNDLDGDGDIDIVSNLHDAIAWYENLDGLGNFSLLKYLDFNAGDEKSVFTIDIDNDNDIDILYTFADRVAIIENIDGFENIVPPFMVTFGLQDVRSVYASDINGDNSIDIISGSFLDDKINWYENLNTLSLNQSNVLNFSVYPIPTENILNIKSKTEIIKIEIYSKLGQLIKETTENKVDISNLTQDLYFVKVEDINGNFGVKKIVKK